MSAGSDLDLRIRRRRRSPSQSKSKLLRKVSWADGLAIANTGVSSRLSAMNWGSSTNASLGPESGETALVVQRGAGPLAFDAAQDPGRLGAVTESKLSLSGVTRAPWIVEYRTASIGVGPSWSCRVIVRSPPQTPPAVKVKLRQTLPPPAGRTP